jgi:hypothetical protein
MSMWLLAVPRRVSCRSRSRGSFRPMESVSVCLLAVAQSGGDALSRR